MSNDRVIIIVLGNGNNVSEGWTAIHNAQYSNCNDATECKHGFIFIKNGQINDGDYDLIICKEDYFNNDLGLRTGKMVAAIHNNANEKTKYEEFLREKALKVNSFSRANDESDKKWNSIKPILEYIAINRSGDYSQLYNALWSVLAPKPSDIAHRLRSEILTPFIPFHLYFQLDNKNESEWNEILMSTCEAIKIIADKNINELLNIKKDISAEYKTALTKAFNDLKKLFSQTNAECIKTQDCRKAIENFADCLEDVINYIEFGEVTSCQE